LPCDVRIGYSIPPTRKRIGAIGKSLRGDQPKHETFEQHTNRVAAGRRRSRADDCLYTGHLRAILLGCQSP
jgi:hypothetical protein